MAMSALPCKGETNLINQLKPLDLGVDVALGKDRASEASCVAGGTL